MVRKPTRVGQGRSALSAIYSLTTPDFLITLCKDNVEIPILTGEFSEAVTTEDHELQRAIVGIAAYLSGAVHLKISGEKRSTREHGGKIVKNLPLIIAKSFQEIFNYNGYIVDEWPTVISNPYVLQRDNTFLSCPPHEASKLTCCVIRKAIAASIKDFCDIYTYSRDVVDVVMESLSSEDEFKNFICKLANENGIEYFKTEWLKRTKKYKNKARIFLSDKYVVIKINRFSHAADPDRGILIFSSLLFDKDKSKPSIYARYEVKHPSQTPQELFKNFILQARNEGISDDFLNNLKKYCGHINRYSTMDITSFWPKTQTLWSRNKVLSAIYIFSDGLIIHAKGENWMNKSLKITWNRKETVLGHYDNLEAALRSMYGFKKYGKPLATLEASSTTEDEVTYIVVHNILRPSSFEIVSVSFPGAQGDAAILPIDKSGRSRPRIYVDIIAWLPSKHDKASSKLLLEENKPRPRRGELNSAVNKIRKLKEVPAYTEALKNTLRRLGYGDRDISKIYIGVGFAVNQRTRTTWNPANVDFIIKIIDRKVWKVAAFEEDLRRAFKCWEGKVVLPKVWEAFNDSSESLLRYV